MSARCGGRNNRRARENHFMDPQREEQACRQGQRPTRNMERGDYDFAAGPDRERAEEDLPRE
jgi:hypothetical protein